MNIKLTDEQTALVMQIRMDTHRRFRFAQQFWRSIFWEVTPNWHSGQVSTFSRSHPEMAV